MPLLFIWQDGGWQKSSEGYLAMYDERTDTPVPLMKKLSRRPAIFYKNCAELLRCAQFEIGVIFCPFPVLLPPIRISAKFLRTTGRDWRNTIYIECGDCQRAVSRGCKNLLCAFDTAGAPVIVPVHDVEYLFSTTVDKSGMPRHPHEKSQLL